MIIVIGYFVRNKLTRTSYLPVQTVYGCTPWGQIIKQCGLEKESYKAALNSLHLTIHLMDEWGTSTWSSSWVFLLFLCKIMQITHLYMPHKWSQMHRLVPASQLQQSCRGGGGDVWWWFFWGRFGWGWRLKLHKKKNIRRLTIFSWANYKAIIPQCKFGSQANWCTWITPFFQIFRINFCPS